MRTVNVISMLIIAMISVGTGSALNPAEMRVSSCPGETTGTGLLFDMYTLEDGYRVWEMTTTSNGLTFSLFDNGEFEYIGEELTKVVKGGFVYYIYRVDESGNPIEGSYQGHTAVVFVDPCEIIIPTCEYRDMDPGDNIQIYPPEINKSIGVSWDVPDANGCWSGAIYENGILNRGRWKGTFPVEVVYTERDWDTYLPTGRVIIDGTCGE